jgi:hypothetical protein
MIRTVTRRQFTAALVALMQAPAERQQTAPQVDGKAQRAAAIASLAAALKMELVNSGAGTWEQWQKRLEPARAQWTRVAAGSRRGRNGYVFNSNALGYLTDTNLESAPEDTRPLDAIVAFDRKMKRLGYDFIYVPIPAIEEVYPENFLDAVPMDLTVQPAMRRFMLSLLERDVEVLDLLRPFQAARDGYRLGLKQDDHWNNVQIELAASLVAERLRRYGFVRAASAQAKRYTTRPVKIEGARGVSEMRQVVTPSGRLYEDVEQSPVLVVGDSNLQIYQYANASLNSTGEHAGFTAHLSRHLGLPVSLSASGGFRLAQLSREPELFEAREVVIFVGATWVLSYFPWSAIT